MPFSFSLNSTMLAIPAENIGLPRILEQTINNILEVPSSPHKKISGDDPRIAIVLRFDECMADVSVSQIHRSAP